MNFKLSTLGIVLLSACPASAAVVTWDAVVVNSVEATVVTAGTLLVASNSAGFTSPTINGVTFTAEPGGPLSRNTGATYFTEDGGDTGSAALNDLLNSHSYEELAGDVGPMTASFEITGLMIGQAYDVQIFAAGDTRSCCDSRTQRFGGGGSFSDDMLRSDPSSVLGHFVADAVTQTIDVEGGAINGVDPGMSGYQVRIAVPEPSGAILLGFSMLLIFRRRT